MKYVLTKSGKIHRKHDDGASFEADNLDDAEDTEELDESEALRLLAEDPKRGCERCFHDSANPS